MPRKKPISSPQKAFRSFLIYKPYGMLSQFTRETAEQRTLADLDFNFPVDVYPVGRLDYDSEGLLLLTNDKTLNFKLLNPENAHQRKYFVQVEGDVTAAAIAALCKGVAISLQGKTYQTMPATVKKIEPPSLPERLPPIRTRLNVPTSWLSISLQEGKNRQVRRMTAAVGFPTLRLVRIQLLHWQIGAMQPGEIVEIEGVEIPF